MPSLPKSLVTVVTAAAAVAALAACTALSHDDTHQSASSGPSSRLPASFPSKEVPLVSGRIVAAGGDRTIGWSVTVEPSHADLADAESALEQDGFSTTASSATHATLADHDYSVFLQTPGKAITYVVTSRSS